ncbi:Protein of unknown function (DUF1399) [Rivularia sp. PCC 7116]|uniref:glycine-rich domain-containing protein n=1 Tax=Rivularia sp. PCC 7116 TaxID=373994 RepID=UPI00029F1B3C|nr:glycine-rich domain-containing protein-like [Rivularia sp. PCC 7116]AFY56145.1 Protein of unknown function (DUF1399) [Rivularia sp. PCC 7116]
MKIVAFFDRVNNLDFEMVAKRVVFKHGWTIERTQVAINRYKLFLYLKSVYPATGLVPTPEIDVVWHAHMEVNLIQYIQDCYYLFGYILNHCSAIYGEQNQATSLIHQQAFSTTKALFEEFFGFSILDNTSLHAAACADIPIDTNPAACADLPIIPNTIIGH